MSYEIIKRIRINENKVLITCAANNVYPHTYEEWESKSLSKILQEQGQEALDVEIFSQFENGNFQRGKNKYTRALHILINMPEYAPFNWRRSDIDYGIIDDNRKGPGYRHVLLKALQSKLPKDRFIISKPHNGQLCYLYKVTKKCVKFTYERSKAKQFCYENDCKWLKLGFTGTDIWNIEKIK